MKKGQGDMLFWFMILFVGALTVYIITIFITDSAKTFDRPPGTNPMTGMIFVLWTTFKLRKLK
ncbi:MAG: hypothetical protein KAS04_01970 [Candidatus Aenigmarchaeota archaeon]|nr:hypothetical protein [Candidatus Aenigmarchaeota archaeon]